MLSRRSLLKGVAAALAGLAGVRRQPSQPVELHGGFLLPEKFNAEVLRPVHISGASSASGRTCRWYRVHTIEITGVITAKNLSDLKPALLEA